MYCHRILSSSRFRPGCCRITSRGTCCSRWTQSRSTCSYTPVARSTPPPPPEAPPWLTFAIELDRCRALRRTNDSDSISASTLLARWVRRLCTWVAQRSSVCATGATTGHTASISPTFASRFDRMSRSFAGGGSSVCVVVVVDVTCASETERTGRTGGVVRGFGPT